MCKVTVKRQLTMLKIRKSNVQIKWLNDKRLFMSRMLSQSSRIDRLIIGQRWLDTGCARSWCWVLTSYDCSAGYFSRMFYFSLQDEKNQIMTTNVWLVQVNDVCSSYHNCWPLIADRYSADRLVHWVVLNLWLHSKIMCVKSWNTETNTNKQWQTQIKNVVVICCKIFVLISWNLLCRNKLRTKLH